MCKYGHLFPLLHFPSNHLRQISFFLFEVGLDERNGLFEEELLLLNGFEEDAVLLNGFEEDEVLLNGFEEVEVLLNGFEEDEVLLLNGLGCTNLHRFPYLQFPCVCFRAFYKYVYEK